MTTDWVNILVTWLGHVLQTRNKVFEGIAKTEK